MCQSLSVNQPYVPSDGLRTAWSENSPIGIRKVRFVFVFEAVIVMLMVTETLASVFIGAATEEILTELLAGFGEVELVIAAESMKRSALPTFLALAVMVRVTFLLVLARQVTSVEVALHEVLLTVPEVPVIVGAGPEVNHVTKFVAQRLSVPGTQPFWARVNGSRP